MRLSGPVPRPRSRTPLPSNHLQRRLTLEALEDRVLLAADLVLQWNNTLLGTIRQDRVAPPVASRALAIVHTAIYDALNSIDRTHSGYLVEALALPHASREAAVAAAAHEALVALFPTHQTAYDTQLTANLAAVPDGPQEDAGVALGRSVADAILAARAADGSQTTVPYTPGILPGQWQPTPRPNPAPPPAELPGLPALLPQWGQVTPFGISRGDIFRPPAPPAPDSAEYAAALGEVKALGPRTSATRTPEQTDIARFWANGAGTSTPPGHWNVIAQTVAQAHGNTLYDNARLFALLNLALADAAIACWDAKYVYSFWRPITAIRAADTDGNSATTADPTWTPLLVTPNFPSYTSGHSTFSGAAATVLRDFFGTDSIAFTVPSEDALVGNRSFTSFAQAAAESAVSRLYAGIHYSFDNNEGLTCGESVGEYVSQHLLGPKQFSAQAGLVNGVLVVQGSEQADLLTVSRVGRSVIVTNGLSVLGRFELGAFSSIQVDGRGGNDVIVVAPSVKTDAVLYGGAGNDVLIGGGGRDRLFGEDGNDVLFGGPGTDVLDGGPGRNLLLP